MAINRKQIKTLLEAHEFGELFNQLGWDWPESDRAYPAQIGEELFELHPVARKRGFMALHCPTIPDALIRAKIESRVSRDIREHIIIFTDEETGKQRWQWVRRVPGQPLSRKEHEYLPNQPMLLIEKLYGLEIPMDEEEEIDLIGVLDKVRSSLDIDKVTKKFYDRFKKEHAAFFGFIDGITEMGDQTWYASVMLNRLMFIYFIQKKGFLDGDTHYLRNRLKSVQATKGKGQFHTFYRYFLMTLCHEVLAKKERTLDKDLEKLIGTVPYLNGGIFQPHELEEKYGEEISIPDEAFVKIFDFFDDFEWHLDNRPTANANEINPDVLGYIFEKYINQKQMGAYYTKEDITEYISKNTIIPCLFDKAQKSCKIAFEGDASVWNLLKADPDRYIYPAVRHGITFDLHNDCEIKEPVPYPDEIEIGLDTTTPELLERRKKWNTRTPEEAGLPTEIWRETVARRQRYADVRGKLERGEVQSINDLITLNLDIRQFAQDVIEHCESPDLLNAFWVAIAGYVPTSGSNKKAVAGITILDPTCGSGAFLFAALNILEPLYEACLERMKGFLEEWERSATVSVARASETLALHSKHPKHPNHTKFFQSILADIEKHPSPKYFIYKSIIIHNLYGVDIMKEATEICKLRLFLKLVAQVEPDTRKENMGTEPLPDIDFNIRAGNTLVGFATEKEMKDFFDREAKGQALLQFDSRLDEVKDAAEDLHSIYKTFCESQINGDGSVHTLKHRLSDELKTLNARLNRYLASDYGVDPSKSKKYDAFLETHQPFHWFIEFYGIIKSGGFDAVIGNPPYVASNKVDYLTKNWIGLKFPDIYALVVLRSKVLCNPLGFCGMIIPLSVTFSRDFGLLRRELCSKGSSWFSSFDNIPAAVFAGVSQRCTIWIGSSQGVVCNTSPMYRWRSVRRPHLVSLIRYFCVDGANVETLGIPKLCTPSFREFLNALVLPKEPSQRLVVAEKRSAGASSFGFSQAARNFISVFRKNPPCLDASNLTSVPQSMMGHISCTSRGMANANYVSLAGDLFFLHWLTIGDGFHVTAGNIKSHINIMSFLPEQNFEYIEALGEILGQLCFEALVFKKNAGKYVGSFNYRKHLTITRRVDLLIMTGMGLSKQTVFDVFDYVQRILSINEHAGEKGIPPAIKSRFKPKPVDGREKSRLFKKVDKVLVEHYGFTKEELDYIINYDIKYRMGKDLLENKEK